MLIQKDFDLKSFNLIQQKKKKEKEILQPHK